MRIFWTSCLYGAVASVCYPSNTLHSHTHTPRYAQGNPLHAQVFALLAEDAAIEDTLYFVGRSLQVRTTAGVRGVVQPGAHAALNI